MADITLSIDGTKVSIQEGKTILEAALAKGIYIPHLCYHPELKPVAVCRLCLVEVNGERLVTACNTPAEEGMIIKTETDEITRIRRASLELIISDHDTDCLTCAKNTNCTLQRLAQYIGVNIERLNRIRGERPQKPKDTSNPFFDFDPNKCVLCGICVRTCDELQRVNAIDYAFRGINTKIAGFWDKPRIETNCESCGECVVRCPVGALSPKEYEKPARLVKTICTYCGCGCGLYLGVRGDRVVSVTADVNNPSNKGRLCVKGRYGYKFINSEERLTTPLIKRDGKFVEISWDEALDIIAQKFSEAKGDRFAAISSAKCTNEENYLIQKFARTIMETNNIDHCARL